MKKLSVIAVLAIAVFSCTPKGENNVVVSDEHQFGVNYDSSANIDAIKATFKDIETYDTVSYVQKYADSAIFHDNLKITTLAENVAMQKQFIAAGIKVKVQPKHYIWGSHFNFKDGSQRDFVYTYITVAFTKEDKTIKVKFFQADQFNKDGKIDREYLVYDQSQLATILN